jgi:hypothetical protein
VLDTDVGGHFGEVRPVFDLTLVTGGEKLRHTEHRIDVFDSRSEGVLLAEVAFDNRRALLGEQLAGVTLRATRECVDLEVTVISRQQAIGDRATLLPCRAGY